MLFFVVDCIRLKLPHKLGEPESKGKSGQTISRGKQAIVVLFCWFKLRKPMNKQLTKQ